MTLGKCKGLCLCIILILHWSSGARDMELPTLYKHLVVLVRSLHGSLRLMPAYHVFRNCNKNKTGASMTYTFSTEENTRMVFLSSIFKQCYVTYVTLTYISSFRNDVWACTVSLWKIIARCIIQGRLFIWGWYFVCVLFLTFTTEPQYSWVIVKCTNNHQRLPTFWAAYFAISF